MSISAAQVKQLRDMTGAGMMDCKAALAETNGNIEEAVDWLRKKGIAKADKKAGRTAAEGLIGVAADASSAVVVEVNSETDFVARNDAFQQMVRNIAEVALTTDGSDEAVAEARYPASTKNVSDTIKDAIGTIGENMSFRRSAKLSVAKGAVAIYVHNGVADNLGKMGVLVAIETEGNADAARGFARQVAMHVAATNPLALTAEEVDASAVEREKAIYADQARQSEDLSAVEAERHVLDPTGHGEVLDLQDHLRIRDETLGWIHLTQLAAHHQGSHGVLVQVGDRLGRDQPSVTQHSDPVGDLLHLGQFVRDEDDGDAAGLQTPDESEEDVGLAVRQHVSRLVHDQDARVAPHGLGDLDHLPVADGEAADTGFRTDLRPELGEQLAGPAFHCPVIEQRAPPELAAEEDVRADAEVIGQVHLLVDEDHAAFLGGGAVREPGRPAVHKHFSGRRCEVAGQDLHQGRLARSVLADDGVNFSGQELYADVVQDANTVEITAYPPRFQRNELFSHMSNP